MGFSAGGTMGVDVQAIETAASIWNWAASDEEVFLGGGEVALYSGAVAAAPTNLAVAGDTFVTADGTFNASFECTWTDANDAFTDHYVVEWKLASDSNYYSQDTKSSPFTIINLQNSQQYNVRVKAINEIGVSSAYITLAPTAAIDTTAPSVPSSISATAGFQSISLQWTNPSQKDFNNVEVYRATSSGGTYVEVSNVAGGYSAKVEHLDGDLADATAYHYKLKSVDLTGNKSAFSGIVTTTTYKIDTANIADNAVENDQIADDAVDTDQIADLAVETDQIDNDAVTIAKVATSLQSTNYSSGSAGWKILKSGVVEFEQATIRGSITATTGEIGGFTVGSTSLIAGANATRVSLSTADGIHLGHNTFASAPFRVDRSGALSVTKIDVSGAEPSIRVGTDDSDSVNLTASSNYRLWVGSLSGEDAKFSVKKDGQLIATGMELKDASGTTYFDADGFTALAYSQIAENNSARVSSFESNFVYNLQSVKVTLTGSSELVVGVKASNLFSGLSTSSINNQESATEAAAIAQIPDNFTLLIQKSTDNSSFTNVSTQTFTKTVSGSTSTTLYKCISSAFIPPGSNVYRTPAEVDVSGFAGIAGLDANGDRTITNTATYAAGIHYFRVQVSTTDTSYNTTLNNIGLWARTLSLVDNSSIGFNVISSTEITQAAGTGDITSVTAGTNLNGGATSGAVILNLDSSISLTNITLGGYLRGPATFTIDPAAHGNDTGTVVIAGNLQVDGTTTTVNSTVVEIADLNFKVAKDAANASAANTGGLTVGGANAELKYIAVGDKWTMNKPLNVTGAITSSGKLEVNQGGSGTTNTPSVVAELSGTNYQGTLRALSLVNSTTASLGNGTEIAFHNASNYSPTGLIQVIQAGDIDTDSKMVFQVYANGLQTALTIDHDKNSTFGGTITATGYNDTNWNTAYTVANAALPKAGGTLTGGLSGTTASFSGTLSSGAITSSGTITTSGSFVGVNAIIDNVIAKTSSGNVSVKTNAGGSIARFNNNLSTDFFGTISSGNITISQQNPKLVITTDSNSTDPIIEMSSSGAMSSEGFHVQYSNNVGDVHLGTSYNNNAAAIRFHTKTSDSFSTSNERFTINGNGNISIVSGTLSMGATPVIDASRNIEARNITATGAGTTPHTFLGTSTTLNVNIGSATQTQYSSVMLTTNDGLAQLWKTGSLYTNWGGADALNIYNSNGNIAFHPSGTGNVLQLTSTLIKANKPIQMSGTTFIDVNRNITVGTISTTALTSSGYVKTPTVGMGAGATTAASIGHTASVNEGLFWHTTNNEYGIYRTSGAWSSPNYQQLKLNWDTGIELDGGTLYGKSGVNVSAGNFKVGGTTVIDASRNATFAKQTINATIVPNSLAWLNIGSTGGGETRAIDIDGSWGAGESKAISFTHGTALTELVGQIKSTFNNPSSSLSFGRLYYSGDSSVYPMVLTSTSTTAADLNLIGNFQISGTTVIDSARKVFASAIQLGTDASPTLTGDSTYLNIATVNGNVDIGAGNSAYLHIMTDRGQFYFNKRLVVDEGIVQSYDEDLNLNRAGSTTARLRITSGNTISDQKLSVTGDTVTTRLLVGDGTDGVFYSDTAGRTAFNSGDFYIQTGVTNFYNYATNQYYGNTSGDNILFRGNPLSGNNWNITGTGVISGASYNVGSTPVIDASRNLTAAQGLFTGTLQVGGTAAGTAYGVGGYKLLFGGGNSDALANYYIGTNLENVGGNYSKLDFVWHTGIRMGAQGQYGGIRFYSNEDLTAKVFSICEGSGSTDVKVYNNLLTGGNLRRAAHNVGHLEGSYNNVGANSLNTNPIYTIGSAYNPASTTLSNMYGIGYTNAGASFISMSGASGWGMYVAADGDARVYLSGQTGGIAATGNITAYASDARLKTNIKPIENALEKLNKIRGVEYDWVDNITSKYDFHPSAMHETGVIAQEIQEVIPDAVTEAPMNANYTAKCGTDHKFLTVQKDKIVPLLIEAIKDQQTEIDELKSLVKQLLEK
jgi:hypothetical protein